MKNYEKLYKDALERAREELGSGCFDRGTVEYIFPKLKESEDERIRKEFCKDIWTYIPNEKAHRYIAWLEKQGEQKPKRVGTKKATGTLKEMLDNIDPIELEETRKEMLEVDGFDAELNALLKKYEYLPNDEMVECLKFYLRVVQGEQKPKWTEEDESKVEDVIYFLDTAKVHYASTKALDNCITWLKSFKQRMEEQQ